VRPEEKGLGLALRPSNMGALILQHGKLKKSSHPESDDQIETVPQNHSSDVRSDCQKTEEIEAPDSMSLNHNNSKKKHAGGHQAVHDSSSLVVSCSKIGTTLGCCHHCEHDSWCSLLAWSPSTWCLYLVPARYFQVPIRYVLTRHLPGTSTWSTST